jgi:hypothetical protein
MTERNGGAGPAWSTLLAALGVGLLAAAWVRSHGLAQPSFKSDFDQVWAAARALLHGHDPYAAVGPNAPFVWKWPLYYPLPALLVTAPLGHLSVLAARMVFAGLSAFAFTWAVTRDGWSRWPIFLSIAFYVGIDLVQWSPLLAAAYFVPWLGALAACKPNFALPLLAGSRTSRSVLWVVGGAAVLVAASFAVDPGWLQSWLANVRSAPHFKAPIARPFGFVLALALLRWRRPEARWLLALSLIPQAPSFYDQLLLVAICTRWWETAILAASTWVLFFYVGAYSPQPDYLSWGALVGNATVWFCYMPCLLMVLRRPNEAPVGRWFTGWRRRGAAPA